MFAPSCNIFEVLTMWLLTRLICVLLLAAAPAAPAVAAGNRESGPAAEAATAAPPPSGLGIRLLDIPAATQDDPRARAYIVDRVAPGVTISRRLRVENNTGSPQAVRVYPGAAQVKDGAFAPDGSEVESELTGWSAADREHLQLASGESADVLATITVPADAFESEHYGVFWAEMRSPAPAGGVVTANRVGVRIYLSVGPGNGKAADFSVTSLAAARDAAGNPEVSALVTNSGGRALDVGGELRLTGGPGGLSAGPFQLQKPVTLAPGDASTATFLVPREIPNGPWNASITLKSGLLERQVQGQVTFPEAAAVAVPAQEPAFPWWLLAVLLLLLALLTWYLLHRRRKRRLAMQNQELAAASSENTGVSA